MRIHGHTAPMQHTLTVQLPRSDGGGPLLTLSPLPLGFARRLREHGVVAPVPPSRVARDPQGRPMRQANGQAVVLQDELDAEYLAERELYHQRVAVLSLVDALRDDPHVVFDTQAADFPHDWKPYADRVYGELEAAGWSAGDLVWVCMQVAKLSNLIETHLSETHADFSSGGVPAPL